MEEQQVRLRIDLGSLMVHMEDLGLLGRLGWTWEADRRRRWEQAEVVRQWGGRYSYVLEQRGDVRPRYRVVHLYHLS